MSTTLLEQPFDHPDWIFEPKLDGLRVLCRFDGEQVTLLSRNDKQQNRQFPEIVDALAKSLPLPAVLDGEIVCLDENGQSSFRVLQQRFHVEDNAEIARRAKAYPAYLYLFDLLFLGDGDVTTLPLDERKKLLHRAVRWKDRIRQVPSVREQGIQALHDACRQRSEGVIGKYIHSTYVGRRSDRWIKLKCLGRQEFVIGGFTDPQRSRVGLGALLVGYYDEGGQLRYAGKVGTGFTRQMLLDLRQRLNRLEARAMPFTGKTLPREAGAHWVQPKLVAEIAFAEWTQNDLLRQPRFEGLREDKPPAAVRRERPSTAPEIAISKSNGAAMPTKTKSDNGRRASSASLETYNRKRKFSETPEPKGTLAKPHTQPIFVIQKHDATRLHYDLRLEADGVLKSWAVTRQPTLDPSVKRLAVQTEDHPLSYAAFEGDIPEGNYGAGHMEIWDRGTYAPLDVDPAEVSRKLESGRLKFELHGERLNGAFALVRMNRGGDRKNWLLIKSKDDAARPESPAEASARSRAASNGSARKGSSATKPTAVAKGRPQKVQYTHEDKIMFPEEKITKRDVLNFYDRIADRLLPYLKDRPATLERLPDGIGANKPHFWQKNTPEYYPEWIPRVALRSEDGKEVNYLLVNNKPTLLYLVNQGTLTFHTWFSRVKNLDRPDFVLFDLDPGAAPFRHVVTIALKLNEILKSEKIPAAVKTSGKTGLHIFTAWKQRGDDDDARQWASEIARRVTDELPDIATMERSKAKRRGRVYVDVMQNVKGHHAVPPYVLRAVPYAGVSTPLEWNEVTQDLDPRDFTLKTIFKRLSRRRRDPMNVIL